MNFINNKEKDNTSISSTGLNKAQKYLLSIILAVILLLLFTSSYWLKHREIKEISILENKYIPIKSIQDKIYPYILKQKLSQINEEYIKSLILSNPYIKKVDFITTFPEKFVVVIKTKNIVGKGTDKDGINYYLTDEGELIPQNGFTVNTNLPTVDIQQLNSHNNQNELSLIAKFLEYYQNFSKKGIKADKIWISDKGICFQILGKISVRVGNLNDIEEKFLKFENYLNDYLSKSNQQPDYIDLRWSNQVVTN